MSCAGRSRAGVDVVSDGEMSKISYATYIKDRLTGFAGDTPREPGQDLVEFPRILQAAGGDAARRRSTRGRAASARFACSSLQPLQTDVQNMQAAIAAAAPSEAIPERGLAWRHRAVSAERLLQDAGRLSRGGRRSDARGVRGDRRRGPAGADRRAGPRDGPAHDVSRPQRRGVSRIAPPCTSKC